MEFIVEMDIHFGNELPEVIDNLLEREAVACRPFFESGEFARAWMTWGQHFGDHGHMALWSAGSAEYVRSAYSRFPLVQCGFTFGFHITPLYENPNDPGAHPLLMADAPFPLTYENLHRFLMRHGTDSHVTNEGRTAELVTGVSIHDHPQSGRSTEIHFMVFGQKVAELGPNTAAPEDEVAPRYIDFLAYWDGKPVHHDAWVNRIKADNGLLYEDYEASKAAPRIRHQLASNP